MTIYLVYSFLKCAPKNETVPLRQLVQNTGIKYNLMLSSAILIIILQVLN